MRRHLLLLTFTLILSHFSILNLWGADYLIPVTPGTSCYNSEQNVTENNRRKIYIGGSGNWADLNVKCPSNATYIVYAGHLTPYNGYLHLYIKDVDQGAHPLQAHDWNTVDETNCGSRGFTAGNNKISLCYNNAGYNATYIRLHDDNSQSTKTVPTSLDFYWTSKQENGDGAKVILNSDFMYDQLGEDDIKKATQGGVNYAIFNANTTASSRSLVCFPATGTYTFTFHVYASETNSDYQKPYVFVNSFMAGGGTFSLNDGSTTDIVIEMDVTAGTYPIAFYIPYSNHADRYHLSTVSIAQKVSCTAPSSVTVGPTTAAGNYGWRYTTGETIDLTCTATGGSGGDYTYQWKKKTGASTWKNLTDGVDATDGGTLSGTTSNRLRITGCTSGNAGTYKCEVSTGEGCTTPSNEFWVRVFTLNGNYSGNSFVENSFEWIDEYNGTATITLNANSVYEFKVTDNDTHTYGLSSPDIYKDENNFVIYGNDGNNVALYTGKVTGTYTFTANVYHANDNNPYVTLTAVRYPNMTIYMSGGSTTWCDGSPVFFAHTYGQANNDVKMTAHACESGLFYADVPSYNTNVIFTRQKPGSESIAWSGDANYWNESQAITIGSNNIFTCTGWDNNKGTFSGSTYSPTTYTISFEGNGSTSGSMTSISSIACDADQAITANAFEKTGYSFANWTANVDVKVNDATVSAGNAIANSATIQNIRSNITLTAQWSVNSYDLTWDLAGGTTTSAGTGIANGVSATTTTSQTYGTSLTAPTVTKTGYNFSAWSPAVAGTMPAANTTYTATWTAKTTSITLDDNDENNGSTSSSVTATWGSVLPAFTATEGVSGYRLKGYYTAKTDGTKIINADGSLVANTDYATNDATPVWKYVGGSVTFYPQYDLVDNMVISGVSNTITDKGWSGNGGSLTITSGNSDVTCGFDHNVLKIDYSGFSDNGAYASKCIEDDADYNSSLSDGATGFGFYYRTSSSTDAVAFVIEYNTSAHNQYKKILAATNGVWKYAYLPVADADNWNRGEVVIFMNKLTQATDGGADIYTANASGTFYIADLKATGVTSKSDISNTAHTVSVSSNNDSYGTASGGGSYYDCNSVTVTAAPESGYRFVNWTQGGSEVSTDEDYTFTMEDLRGDASSVTLVANFEEVICSSSRTYQVEDILIAAGGVTCNDAQADGANTLVVNSTTNTSSSHYSDYMNNESGPYGGGYVMNTAASKTIYMEVDIPSAGSYDIALWYGKNNGDDKVEWLNIYTRTLTSYTTLTYGGNTYYKLEKDGYRVSSTASSSYYISTTPYEKKNLSLPAGKIVIGIWSENANAVYDQIRITHHDDSDVFCKHDITVNNTSGASGSATASVSKALAGETVTVTAAAASDGYNFTGWTVTSGSATFADASALSTTFVMPDADVTVQANYASSGYVVNYEVVGGNGTITSVKDGSGNDISSGDAVASGTVLTFTASPSSGYAVLGWYTYLNSTETLQGNTQNSNTFNYEVTGAITIRVKFATPYTLTLNSSPAAASATVSGGGSYVEATTVPISTSTENGDYTFVHWMDGESEVSTSAASNYVMPASNKTLTAVWRQSRISSLSWSGSEDLGSGMEIASSCFDGGCFDTDVTFTFTGSGTVTYYDHSDHSSSLGTLTSGTAINLNDNLRAHGIYIKCTSGSATLTGVEKTTVGSVYTIWSGSVNVSANYTGIDENGDKVTLEANAGNDWWLQQVVLGPEHFQTAAVGDTLRVTYIDKENEYAKGAIQTATKYSAIPGNIYNESDGSQVTTNTHDFDLPNSGYYHIITAGSLDSLQHKGIVVKGKGHTITRVSLHASCSNLSLRTTAPDVTTRSGVDIMASSIDFGAGFDLGNWEHKVELDESCFTNVTVGSIINLYMSVDANATLSFRCNVPSIIADDKQGGEGCPSYGDISFDRTIDDLYGHTPTVVGETEGYKVMYLKVDADMMRRLKETGMILCGKGTLIKVVEGVEETVIVNPNENKDVPTVVNNIIIYQGGEVSNDEDIMVLGTITYIRPAVDDGTSGKLGNQLNQWYTFAVPFTVSEVEVYDETDKKWFDVNAVYYSSDATDQSANSPDGKGHFYMQYLGQENATGAGSTFAARWLYMTPNHSLAIEPEWNDGTRYGYPMKDSAYIVLFDSSKPTSLAGYWASNPTVRFVGGAQTIAGVEKTWKVEADGEQYWMYANNTLHSFTLDGDAYILDSEGNNFNLQETPTIRPFECYVQGTDGLKAKYESLPMRRPGGGGIVTGMEKTGLEDSVQVIKVIEDGRLIIIRNGRHYNATGERVK